MKMVRPTLTSIQNRHPDPHPPLLPPPPNTIIKRFSIKRKGSIPHDPFSPKSAKLRAPAKIHPPGAGGLLETHNRPTTTPMERSGNDGRRPHGMTMQAPLVLPRLQRNILPPQKRRARPLPAAPTPLSLAIELSPAPRGPAFSLAPLSLIYIYPPSVCARTRSVPPMLLASSLLTYTNIQLFTVKYAKGFLCTEKWDENTSKCVSGVHRIV
jgi:hypothetical protein